MRMKTNGQFINTITEPDVQRILKETMEGLAYLHNEARVVHLDIKPGNLLLDSHFHIKIADFGISKVMGPNGTVFSDIGTVAYLCPELMQGTVCTGAADIWSLGMTIYELLNDSNTFGATEFDHLEYRAACNAAYDVLAQRGLPPIQPVRFAPSEFLQSILRCMLIVSPSARLGASQLLYLLSGGGAANALDYWHVQENLKQAVQRAQQADAAMAANVNELNNSRIELADKNRLLQQERGEAAEKEAAHARRLENLHARLREHEEREQQQRTPLQNLEARVTIEKQNAEKLQKFLQKAEVEKANLGNKLVLANLRVEEMRAEKNQLANGLQAELEAAKQQIRQIESGILTNAASGEAVQHLQDQIAALQLEKNSSNEANQNLQHEIQKLYEQIQMLQQQSNSLPTMISQSCQSEAPTQSEHLRTENENLKKELNLMSIQYADAENTIKQLAEQLDMFAQEAQRVQDNSSSSRIASASNPVEVYLYAGFSQQKIIPAKKNDIIIFIILDLITYCVFFSP